jgi:DNA-directed RNA polymerase subunit RPC12/RpoP
MADARSGLTAVVSGSAVGPASPTGTGPETFGGAGLGDEREPVLRATCCPQCAGPLHTIGDSRTLKCEHCGVRLLVQTKGGCARWFFRPKVERLQAVARGSDWLAKQPGILGAARRAHFVEARLLYLPIWEYRALVTGWEFGQRLRTRLVSGPLLDPAKDVPGQDTLELKVAPESVQEGQLHERRYYEAAADLGALGVNRPRITGREFAVPLLPGEIDADAFVLEAEGSAAEIADQGRKVVLAPVSAANSPDAHLFALREATTLLYYPLWSLHYVFEDRRYAVMIDGRNGTVHSGTAPASNAGRVGAFMGGLALLAVIVAVLAHHASGPGATSLSAVAAGVIVSAAALVSAWRFRLRGEVEYHEPFSS